MLIASVLVGLVALIHVYILVLEMFLWDTPKGRKVFGTTAQFSAESKVLAANQGLYNGFLAAGLVVALITRSRLLRRFTLACVIVAGIYGAATLGDKAVFIGQSLPALLALILTELGERAARQRTP